MQYETSTFAFLSDRDLLIAKIIRFTDLFYTKILTRQPSKLVNKKSWLQAILKHCINFSELEHLPVCDIYNLKLPLGVWSLKLFLYRKAKQDIPFLKGISVCRYEAFSRRTFGQTDRLEPSSGLNSSPFLCEALLPYTISRLLSPSVSGKMCWPEGNKQDSWLGSSLPGMENLCSAVCSSDCVLLFNCFIQNIASQWAIWIHVFSLFKNKILLLLGIFRVRTKK